MSTQKRSYASKDNDSERRRSSEPWQVMPDMDAQTFTLLKASITERGQHYPIVVDADTGEVIDGHQRLRAAKMAGLQPNIERRKFADDNERRMFALEVNLVRRELGPVAWGTLFAQYLDAIGKKRGAGRPNGADNSLRVKELAEQFGVGETTAFNRMATAEALEDYPHIAEIVDKSVRNRPEDYSLSQQRAKEIVTKAPEIADKLEQGEITVKDTKREKGVIEALQEQGVSIPPYPTGSTPSEQTGELLRKLYAAIEHSTPQEVAKERTTASAAWHARSVPDLLAWLERFQRECRMRALDGGEL